MNFENIDILVLVLKFSLLEVLKWWMMLFHQVKRLFLLLKCLKCWKNLHKKKKMYFEEIDICCWHFSFCLMIKNDNYESNCSRNVCFHSKNVLSADKFYIWNFWVFIFFSIFLLSILNLYIFFFAWAIFCVFNESCMLHLLKDFEIFLI